MTALCLFPTPVSCLLTVDRISTLQHKLLMFQAACGCHEWQPEDTAKMCA